MTKLVPPLDDPRSLPARLLRQFDGPLTDDLRRAPAQLGLGQLPMGREPDATTRSVCGFCSTGCSLTLHLRESEAVGLTPTTDYPVNRGMACPKGWEALRVLEADDRATAPLLRGRNGRLAPTEWKTALATFVGRIRAIQDEHGPESVAFLSTGQIPTEEMALLGLVAKLGMGLVHGDGNTRQCMASAVTAYKESFGFDAPPYTYADLEESDVLVFVGANPAIAHPILWQRVLLSPRKPKIIVIDPRRTETAMAATHHLALKPKSDLVLFYGLAKLLIDRGAVDREFVAAHTSGFDDFTAHVADYDLARVSEATGLSAETLEEVATLIGRPERVSFWWTMGVNQSYEGTRVAQSLINLALLTGNIGRPGSGANSITGQANAMGSRLFSNTSSLFGGRSFEDANDRAEVAKILDVDEERIPKVKGRAYDQIVDGIATGAIRGLWVIATNSAHSWIGQRDFKELLGRLDFLVVQDLYSTTETALEADLVLPAAGWGEKDGTFINSERRIGVIRKTRRPPGQALTDFSIFRLIAEAWGAGDLIKRWTSPAAAFEVLKELSRHRPCDFSGVGDHDTVAAAGGTQWPWTLEDAAAGAPAPERRLFEDHRFHHPDGRARFVFEAPRRMPEPPNEAFPFLLLTGRGSAAQWHTQTRTSKSAVLRSLYPNEAYVEVHPDDARALGIARNAWTVVESQRGHMLARAYVTPCVQRGQVFVPMHYASTNQLTDPAFDPYSRQPSYKACAVRLRPYAAGESL